MSTKKDNSRRYKQLGLLDKNVVSNMVCEEDSYHRYKRCVKEKLLHKMSVNEYLNDQEFMNLIASIIREESDGRIDSQEMAKKIFQSIRQNDVIQDFLEDDFTVDFFSAVDSLRVDLLAEFFSIVDFLEVELFFFLLPFVSGSSLTIP